VALVGLAMAPLLLCARPVGGGTPAFVQHPRQPGSVMGVRTPCPWVGLTFDDGPHATLTPQVLDLLARHGATATFYVVGERVMVRPDLIRRAAAEGHSIGNHTWDHRNLTGRATAEVLADLDATDAAIRDAGVRPVAEVRPPRGRLDPWLGDAVRASARVVVHWEMSPDRLARRWDARRVADHLVRRTRPGAIFLLHDGGPAGERSIRTLAPLLEAFEARGLRAVSVDRLLDSAVQRTCPPT